MDNLQKLYQICDLLNKRFGDSTPFMIMTRLMEEVGELAEQVNHFESTGIKSEKLGAPDKKHMAKEAQDVIRAVLHIVQKYNIQTEFEENINDSLTNLQKKFANL